MAKKIDEWYQHEGLDRCHMLLNILGQAFGQPDEDFEASTVHPSIWNEECNKLLSEATKALADLYQKIGEWDE